MGKLWEKYKGINVQAKAALWFALCSILQKGISFITVPVFTRVLTEEQYGTYSLYLSWLSILTIITSLYLFNGVLNNAMIKFKEERDRYISSMQGLTVTISTVVFGVFLCFQNDWEALFGLTPIYIYLMFLEAYITPALYYWSGRQRFEYKYRKLVAITLAKSIANPVIGLLAVCLAEDKALARVSSAVLIEVVFCGTVMVLQFARGRKFFDKKCWKYALVMGIPLLPHYLSGQILNQADRIMIEKMVGISEVAFYSVAYNIGMLVQIFTLAMGNAITPWLYQKLKSKDHKGIGQTINFLLLVISCISFALMLCSPEIVLVLGSEKYASAVYVIPPVAASVFFIFLYNLLAIPQFYYEKTNYMLIASVLAAVANLIMNYVFINLFGYLAAGYTTLACYIIYSLGHFVISRRLIREHTDGMENEIYDRKMILLLSAITVFWGIGCNFLFHYVVFRYALLTVVIVITFYHRNRIIELLNKMKR